MRAKDKEKLGTLRLITAAIKQIEVDERIDVDETRMLVVLDKLAKQLGVDVLAKVIFSFTSDIIMSPLALPRNILDAWIDELVPQCSGALADVLLQLKQRLTFEEQWPDAYADGLRRGKIRILKLESIRTNNITMKDILAARSDVSRWWHGI